MAYKHLTTRIKLNNFMKEIIDNQIWLQHRMWNWLVENLNKVFQDAVDNKKRFPTDNEIIKQLKTVFKEQVEQPWCGNRMIRSVVFRYSDAWIRALTIENQGDPNFHKWSKTEQSVTFSDTTSQITEDHIFRPQASRKIHWSKRNCKIYDTGLYDFIKNINGKVKQYTISRINKKYYITFCVEYDLPEPIKSQKGAIGLDWNIKNFLVDQDGKCYNFPEKIMKLEVGIRKLQRVLKQKQLGSKNRLKVQIKLNKLYKRQVNLKRDWIEKTTTWLLKNHSLIVIEKLNMLQIRALKTTTNKMRNRMNLFPFGWFRDRLLDKQKFYTCRVLELNPLQYPTSQICCNCGARKKRSLKERTIHCEECGNVIDRDVNAAKNLVKFGKEITSYS